MIIPYTEATQSGVIPLGIFTEIPMVCTEVGGLQEQLTKDECVWVQPNEKALTEGIKKIINNPTFYNELKVKMREKKSQLSWQKIAKQVENYIISSF